MNDWRKSLKIGQFYFDPVLLALCSFLLVIGYAMVVSASMHLGPKEQHSIWHYPINQLVHIALGVVAGFAVAKIPMYKWESMAPSLFLVGIALLIIVLIPGLGVKVNGSVRWLSLGGLRIQVSEVVKFFSVVYMASYVTRYKAAIQQSAYGLLKPLTLFFVACLLLLCEPDFGSSVVLMMIAMGVMFLAGARLSQFFMLLAILAVAGFALIYFWSYRLKRFTSFIDPFDEKLVRGDGYQLANALIAIGRGEWTGVGFGNGVLKLFYLPENHTDFIFSVIGEETGLLGVVAVIALFSVLVWRIFKLAQAAEDSGQTFPAFIAYGLGIWFGFQAIVNMGVNMGILPTKGLTLPLMSYGGGSMVVMCSAVGLLFRVKTELVDMAANGGKAKVRNRV